MTSTIHPNNTYLDALEDYLLKLLDSKEELEKEKAREEPIEEELLKPKEDYAFSSSGLETGFDNAISTPSNLTVIDNTSPLMINTFNDVNLCNFQPFQKVDIIYNDNTNPKKSLDVKFKKMKKENVDKKVIRTFRRFLKNEFKSQNPFIIKIINDNSFWKDFITENLVPPFSYLQENKKFKSFNTKFKIWLFEHKFSENLYELFIQKNFHGLMSFFNKKYKIDVKDEEYAQIEIYLKSFPTCIGV